MSSRSSSQRIKFITFFAEPIAARVRTPFIDRYVLSGPAHIVIVVYSVRSWLLDLINGMEWRHFHCLVLLSDRDNIMNFTFHGCRGWKNMECNFPTWDGYVKRNVLQFLLCIINLGVP
jgi:hypothetical protein